MESFLQEGFLTYKNKSYNIDANFAIHLKVDDEIMIYQQIPTWLKPKDREEEIKYIDDLNNLRFTVVKKMIAHETIYITIELTDKVQRDKLFK